MAAANYDASLAFVWRPGYDNPADGYHVTPGDAGGGTFGGVIETSWGRAVAQGLVRGYLRHASIADLSIVLRADFWGHSCDALPAGLDFSLFNGRMMSGGYPRLFQQALGATVDGDIGPETLARAKTCDAEVVIRALTGLHYAYLTKLPSWPEFKGGWTARLLAAREFALALVAV